MDARAVVGQQARISEDAGSRLKISGIFEFERGARPAQSHSKLPSNSQDNSDWRSVKTSFRRNELFRV